MGRGGYLWIVNATSKKLIAGSSSSYQMDTWSFEDIASHSKKRFYIEFEDNINTLIEDDACWRTKLHSRRKP